MKWICHLLALLVLSTTQSHAADCDKVGSQFDKAFCQTRIYVAADDELNATYQQLYDRLDADGRHVLKNRQQSWIRYRNDTCTLYSDQNAFINMQCAYEATVEKTQFLQDRLRECKSVGCLNSKLHCPKQKPPLMVNGKAFNIIAGSGLGTYPQECTEEYK